MMVGRVDPIQVTTEEFDGLTAIGKFLGMGRQGNLGLFRPWG
jgi:hypothetical protein